MARPAKKPGEKAEGHQITLPPGLWAELAEVLENGETRSGVIGDLARAFVDDRKARKAGRELAELKKRVARLEDKSE